MHSAAFVLLLALPALAAAAAESCSEVDEEALLQKRVAHHTAASKLNGSAKVKSLLFVLADGMGPEIVTMTRQFKNARDGLWQMVPESGVWDEANGPNPAGRKLAIDHMMSGQAQTRAANSHITDSAAGITPYTCGARTNNGWVSKVPKGPEIAYPWEESEGLACKSIMQKAKEAGFGTGTIATSRFSHATPAGYMAHTVNRNKENEIAYQAIENNMTDIIIGGGARHLYPQSVSGSKREDDWNGFARAEELGYVVIANESAYKEYKNSEKYGTCHRLLMIGASSHLPYVIDCQDCTWPVPLHESIALAIRIQSACGKPWMMMMEASRIDHALHEDDAGATIFETLEMDKAIEQGILPNIDNDTLLLATADHSCAGISLGMSDPSEYAGTPHVSYAWYPQVFEQQQGSFVEKAFKGMKEEDALCDNGEVCEEGLEKFHKAIKDNIILPKEVISPPSSLNEMQFSPTKWLPRDFDEVDKMITYYLKHKCKDDTPPEDCNMENGANVITSEVNETGEFSGQGAYKQAATRMIANKAYISAATSGHTSVDVEFYCKAPRGTTCAELGFIGNEPNYVFGQRMAAALGLNPEVVTYTPDNAIVDAKPKDDVNAKEEGPENGEDPIEEGEMAP